MWSIREDNIVSFNNNDEGSDDNDDDTYNENGSDMCMMFSYMHFWTPVVLTPAKCPVIKNYRVYFKRLWNYKA